MFEVERRFRKSTACRGAVFCGRTTVKGLCSLYGICLPATFALTSWRRLVHREYLKLEDGDQEIDSRKRLALHVPDTGSVPSIPYSRSNP